MQNDDLDLGPIFNQTVLSEQLRPEVDIILENIKKAGNISELQHIQACLPDKLLENPGYVFEIYQAINQAIVRCHQGSDPFFTHTCAKNYFYFQGNQHKNTKKEEDRIFRLTERRGRRVTRKAYIESTMPLLDQLAWLAIAEGQQEQKNASPAADLTKTAMPRPHDNPTSFNSHKKLTEGTASPAFWQQPRVQPTPSTPPSEPTVVFIRSSMKRR